MRKKTGRLPMKSLSLKETAGRLLSQDGFLLVTHRNPDGDTLCSAAALCSALRRAGKAAFLFCNPQITEKYDLFVHKYLQEKTDDLPSYTIAVDTATKELLSEGYSGEVDLCIDHHPTNSFYATETIVWPEKAACGEIILKLIEELHQGLTKEEADLLYIALSTDCGCFQYANTNSDAFLAAARLVQYGADNAHLNIPFFRKVSRQRVTLEGMIYAGLTYYREGKVVIAAVTREMMDRSGATEDDCDDLAAIPGRVQGEIVGITIREMEDGTSKISVRTTEEVSAISICAAFGGGGHEMAAGCRINAGVERAKELLLAVVDEVYQ